LIKGVLLCYNYFMILKLNQVYYDINQELDKGCVPYCSIDNEPILYENQHILDLFNRKDHLKNDYWGVTSWRMNEKTKLTYDRILSEIKTNNNYDVYIYNNYGNEFNLLQNEEFPIGKIIKRLYAKKVIPFTNKKLEWVNVFCNYWIAKPEIVDKYINEFLLPVKKAFETDDFIKDILKKEKLPYRGKDYPYQPFIMEYLFGLFLYHYPEIRYYRIPDKNTKGFIEHNHMKTLNEIFENFKEQKLFSGGGDKGTIHHYIESYDRLFSEKRNDNINVLEIGINRGESLKMWREYFPNANIYGIDITLPEHIDGVTMYTCDQVDQIKLDELFKNINFDIIVDDGSHKIQHQFLSLKYLWSKLNKDALYVIEDIQEPEIDIPLLSSFKKPTEIIDTREISKRYDDILIVWKK
jgi:23S rRNA U2552 (ribose-2'-O)-methylase RlmE/FtsJ